ncbi:MAG TPA: peptide chain release factor 2, partial [Gimesia maris]|nr:peptide chain release factor 2 [Gimesia maris]
KKKRAAEINELMGAAGFWDNQEKAQGLVNEMQQIQLVVKPLTQLVEGAEDLEVLIEFIEEEGSEDSIPELSATAERLESILEHLELQAMMSAPEDGSAAYLSIQAGEGGTDSSDWAEMLLRMYLR